MPADTTMSETAAAFSARADTGSMERTMTQHSSKAISRWKRGVLHFFMETPPKS
jgi:hypothetical protein